MTNITNETMMRVTTTTSRRGIGKKGKIRKKATPLAGEIDRRTLTAHPNWKAEQYAWHRKCK